MSKITGVLRLLEEQDIDVDGLVPESIIDDKHAHDDQNDGRN